MRYEASDLLLRLWKYGDLTWAGATNFEYEGFNTLCVPDYK
jgi:hypothetical protein